MYLINLYFSLTTVFQSNIIHFQKQIILIKKIIALFFSIELESQIKANEIPIIKYKAVQTGPKIQLGGLKLGLTKY